jgi:predicted peptidase
MSAFRAAAIGCFVAALVSCASVHPMPETGFLNRSVTVEGRAFPYVVYVPRDWKASARLPVILFLHGAGERGSDGLKQTQVGLGSEIRFNPTRVPAIVVFPQAPEDERWIGDPAEAALLALDAAMDEFHGDPDRVYLTGLSMGGFGTWHLALMQPHRFAALVTVCGGIVPHGSAISVRQSPLTMQADDPYAFTAHALRHIPIRIFHGSDDIVVLPSESRRMYEALMREAADVKYTEYAGVNHGSWERAYGEPELWTWLFAQKRR